MISGGFVLGIGVMSQNFHSFGKVLVDTEVLKIIDNGIAMMSHRSLYSLVGMPSGLDAFFSESFSS